MYLGFGQNSVLTGYKLYIDAIITEFPEPPPSPWDETVDNLFNNEESARRTYTELADGNTMTFAFDEEASSAESLAAGIPEGAVVVTMTGKFNAHLGYSQPGIDAVLIFNGEADLSELLKLTIYAHHGNGTTDIPAGLIFYVFDENGGWMYMYLNSGSWIKKHDIVLNDMTTWVDFDSSKVTQMYLGFSVGTVLDGYTMYIDAIVTEFTT